MLYVTVYITVYTLAFIAVMRYLSIVHSNRSSAWVTRSRVCLMIGLLWPVVCLSNGHAFVLYRVKEYAYGSHEPYVYCGIVDQATGRRLFVSFFVFAYVVPLCVITVLYVLVLRFLNNQWKRRTLAVAVTTSPKRRLISPKNQPRSRYLATRVARSLKVRKSPGPLDALPVITGLRRSKSDHSLPDFIVDSLSASRRRLDTGDSRMTEVVATSWRQRFSLRRRADTMEKPFITNFVHRRSTKKSSTKEASSSSGDGGYHRERLNSRSAEERSRERNAHAIRLLIVVVTVFAVSWLPLHLHLLVSYFISVGYKAGLSNTYEAFRVFFHVLAYANSCMNPVIYNYVSKDFRKGFRELFTLKICRQPSGTSLDSPRTFGNGSAFH